MYVPCTMYVYVYLQTVSRVEYIGYVFVKEIQLNCDKTDIQFDAEDIALVGYNSECSIFRYSISVVYVSKFKINFGEMRIILSDALLYFPAMSIVKKGKMMMHINRLRKEAEQSFLSMNQKAKSVL